MTRSAPSTSLRTGLEIRLFGRPEIRRGTLLLPSLPTRKTQSLLAYLVLHRDRPHSRDELATLFWGDQSNVRARRSLATALWRIRRLFAGIGVAIRPLWTKDLQSATPAVPQHRATVDVQ